MRDGILYASEAQRIVRPDGTEAEWMFDSLGFSLEAEGARLAARALLEQLRHFEGRQLATYGLTAVPLLQAVVLESGGRYRGLLVRKEVKPRGSLKRIEGRIALDEPVVVLDDSVASGASVLAAAQHCRAAGLEVEGAVCLVRFDPQATDTLAAHGVPLRAVLDLAPDVLPHLRGGAPAVHNPTRQTPGGRRGARAPDLPEPEQARAAMEALLSRGELLQPRPSRARVGGVFISVRDRDDLDVRHARDGVLAFPDEAPLARGEALMLAAARTAAALREVSDDPRAVLARSVVAVTVFPPLERCHPGKLDERRFGVVVRSLERPGRIGGALPGMPGIRDAFGQYTHAARRNAQLHEHERAELYRHRVEKSVEGAARWQPTGVAREAWWGESSAARKCAAAALALVHGGKASFPQRWPAELGGLFLSRYDGGALRGCAGVMLDQGADAPPAETVERLAHAVERDGRFGAARPGGSAVVLSFLRQDLVVGDYGVEDIMGPTRLGQQAMAVRQGERSALLLPHVMVRDNLEPQEFAQAAVDKAGLSRRSAKAPWCWTRFDAASWLADALGVRPFVDGAGVGPASSAEALSGAWRDFLEAHHRPRGTPVVLYRPFDDVQVEELVPHWLLHGAWVKARAGLARQAREDLARAPLDDATPTTLAFALLTRQALGLTEAGLPERLLACLGPSGEPRLDDAAWLDFTPGQLWLALARGWARPRPEVVERGLGYLRRRWRAQPGWGAVAWVAQAAAAWARRLSSRAHLALCEEVFAWALPWQSDVDGAFLDGQVRWTGTGATTAVTLEGLAPAIAAARALGQPQLARREERAFARGLSFLDSLTWQARDASVLPAPERACGGLRLGPLRSDVRLDFVQHALSAVLELR
ncbi:MAG: AMMECR1 domain-containing protein [Myxococcaceae bacterium]|nr:AMMECR1 domain-containing protein [Myxococcaceae bacterium]